ncbi:nickel/cobalt ABC transporter permease [Paenibacillus sp. J22TS3]|uniref:staphylopine uptake ABC transporter permease subunit CntC n=1 Tax=Paenibacillus sp. J22TS3 TaxID=2807192 RepID=UPI001B0E6D64|nr:nickel/cobalt ABC transporter permease [Paenibacillus sp. J22TS3]GIP19744.1 peptide ABC transporter permease [Paenibacillus sp. J22TS3]
MRTIRSLGQNKLTLASLMIVLVILLAGICAPVFAPHDPNEVNMKLRYSGPSWDYWLGNDHLGRCVLSRLIFGIRPSVLWVLITLAISVGIGAVVGFIAGYFKGKTDNLIMRTCDVMLSFPGYVMTLAVVGILGPGLWNILIAFVVMKWAWFARVIRTSVMQYSEMGYIQFSRACGISHVNIIRKHLIPVTLSDIAVIASNSISSMILQISGLSFLGMGIQAPNAEWGMMLNEAKSVMFSHPELMLAPGAAMVIMVTAFNFLADGIQIALDPKRMRSQDSRQEEKVEKSVYEYVGS